MFKDLVLLLLHSENYATYIVLRMCIYRSCTVPDYRLNIENYATYTVLRMCIYRSWYSDSLPTEHRELCDVYCTTYVYL
jgi:hypothetical protein